MKWPLFPRVAIGLFLVLAAGPSFASGGLLAHYAVLLGPDSGTPEVTSTKASAALSWTPEDGAGALRELFGLVSLDAFQVGSVLLDSDGGRFSATVEHSDSEVRIRLRVQVEPAEDSTTAPPDIARTQIEVGRDRAILAVPTVSAPLGEVALICRGSVDEAPPIWIVLRVEQLT